MFQNNATEAGVFASRVTRCVSSMLKNVAETLRHFSLWNALGGNGTEWRKVSGMLHSRRQKSLFFRCPYPHRKLCETTRQIVFLVGVCGCSVSIASGHADGLSRPQRLEDFQRTTDLEQLDPKRFALDMIARGDYRFIGVAGWTGGVPGARDRNTRCRSNGGSRNSDIDPYVYFVPRTSDADGLDSDTEKALMSFALRYNLVVKRELKKLGLYHRVMCRKAKD